jgi:hypothetical protein
MLPGRLSLACGVLSVLTILSWSFASVLINSARRRHMRPDFDEAAQAIPVRDQQSPD